MAANIGYRTGPEATAPAAAEDVRHAVERVRTRAAEWGADGRAPLLAGFSAGAHLALLAAVAPEGALGGPRSAASGIVSFWGITDVADLLEGDHARDFARRWLPDRPGRMELARRLSPLRYDLAEAPPVCAVHSVHDGVVPFAHSEKLVTELRKKGRRAKLIRLTHEGHAAPERDYPAIFEEAFGFLEAEGEPRA